MTKFAALLLFFVVIATSTPLYGLDKDGNFESKAEQDRYVADILIDMANDMNRQAPMMMDADTQLSNVLALKKSINFTMRLVNLSSNEVDATVLNKYVWGNVNDIACKTQATRNLIDIGVSYVYIYFGNDDRLITKVTLDTYKCGQSQTY